jgi:hypothetical protein
MIVGLTGPGLERDRAMALWSTFVPVGVGAGTAITGLAEGLMGARAVMLGWALLSLLLLMPIMHGKGPAPLRRGRAIPAMGAWLLSLGFGCYTLFLCALTGLLPLFLFDRHGTAMATGSAIAGGIALSALPGTGLSLALLRQGLARRRRMIVLGGVLGGAALLAPMIFLAPGLIGCAVLAGAAGAGGCCADPDLHPSACVERRKRCRGVSSRSRAACLGAGAVDAMRRRGALLGPPLGALLVQGYGWGALGVLIGGLVLVLLICLVGAEMAGAN